MTTQWGRMGALLLALGGLAVVVLCSVALGSRSLPLGTVLEAFTDFDGSNEHQIVRDMRVPRTAVGLAVGAALGSAGAVMQGVTRNPLADPGILGIEAGAAFAVVVAIHSFDIHTLPAYVWFAFAGAGLASLVVYALGAMGAGGATPVKLALAGAALTALLTSLTSAVLMRDVDALDQYRFWVVGSLAGRDQDVFAQVIPFLAVGLVLALASARLLNVVALGDDVARSLGLRMQTSRALAAVAVVLLSGAATAAAGPIGFVGLTIPHVARVISGPDYRWILPWSLVLAPTLLLGADVIGRLVVRPGELQVGIITAVVGAPFFITLVRHRRLATL